MLRTMPTPVLAVTHDVLRDIDGDGALSSLWFLFNKCKGNLHDGQRLENISWRLWHRELSSDTCQALTPTSTTGALPARGAHGRAATIGKLIDDVSAQVIALSAPRSQLPTPTPEPVSIAIFSAPNQSPPRRPPTTADSGFPRVVVVNPTPNRSPHPTPPHSPVLKPRTSASLKPADAGPKFSFGSPSSESSESQSSSSASSSASSSSHDGADQVSSSTTTGIPPSLCRTDTSPAIVQDHWRQRRQPHARIPSVKERARLDAEDRELELQQKHEQEREMKQRQETEDRQRIINSERERGNDRRRQEEQREQDRRRTEEQAQIEERMVLARQHERERSQRQQERDGQLRRTASAAQLPLTAIFEFADETPNDHLQPSGSSHPDLTRSFFGLNRALSPPKAPVKAPKAKTVRSATNLQALASAKAAMRMQNTLKGAFTPMAKGSPTKSESSKSASSRSPKVSPPKPLPPSLKGKEKAVTTNNRPIVVVSDSDEEWMSDDDDQDVDDDDNYEDEDDDDQPASKATSPPPPPPPPPVNHRTTRNRRPAEKQKHLRTDELHHAFQEAERQKETFTFDKLPKRTYSNLSRTNSGLLSQLMNPDPQVLPDFYRRGYSSGDLTERPRPHAHALHPSQSAVALPLAAQVHVGSDRPGGLIKTVERETRHKKTPPREMEMDPDSDGDDNDSNSLDMSTSVAHQKLKAIFGNMHGGGANSKANVVVPRPPPTVGGDHQDGRYRMQSSSATAARPSPPPPLERTMTEPIAVPSFPYNLPVAAIPVSPRTTRQRMLRTEMSESVRTNLLWQRKMDKKMMPAPRRNKSSTSISSVVKITEKKDDALADGSAMMNTEREHARNEIRRVNLMRNKSWAADFHPQ